MIVYESQVGIKEEALAQSIIDLSEAKAAYAALIKMGKTSDEIGFPPRSNHPLVSRLLGVEYKYISIEEEQKEEKAAAEELASYKEERAAKKEKDKADQEASIKEAEDAEKEHEEAHEKRVRDFLAAMETAKGTKTPHYKHYRKYAYASQGDQNDMRYWDDINGTTTLNDHITAVKNDYRKP